MAMRVKGLPSAAEIGFLLTILAGKNPWSPPGPRVTVRQLGAITRVRDRLAKRGWMDGPHRLSDVGDVVARAVREGRRLPTPSEWRYLRAIEAGRVPVAHGPDVSGLGIFGARGVQTRMLDRLIEVRGWVRSNPLKLTADGRRALDLGNICHGD
jgi:hypothetical protein